MLLPRDLVASISVLLSVPTLVSAVFECDHIPINGQVFELKSLGGPHNVHWIQEDTPPTLTNTTFTIDICQALPRHKDTNTKNDCPPGTRVCGIEYDYNLADGSHMIRRVIPIAGNYAASNGRQLEPKFTRLKESASNADAEKEGLRMELHGGKYPDEKGGTAQKAVIEFLCDPERSGLGGDEPDKREPEKRNPEDEKEDESDDKDKDDKKKENKDLTFVSYKKEQDTEVLRLEWRTKYACEGKRDTGGDASSGHWGFFTWFIIILFLGVSAYLIFGSWLNYNRYGARGWDLVPHGDTLRDMPYLMKDWGRRVVSTVQGGGSRGGYSAV